MKIPAMVIGIALLVACATPTICAQTAKAQPAIALVGGTLVDVSNFGHSTHDIPNAVVVVRGSKIEVAGPAALVKIPNDAKRINCQGTYILPGLIDGFAGLNSQAQANAWLYMGVTTIVALQDPRRGFLKFDAHPSPHIYPLDIAGSMDSYSFLMSNPRWSSKVKNADDSVDLDEPETKAQIEDLAHLERERFCLVTN